MLGNGVKRKRDDDEAGLEEDQRPVAVCSVWQVSCRPQPQTILNMSLMKLYGPRTNPHLALQRRVLINNIIRQIHKDLRQEGGVGTLFFSAAPPAAPDPGGESSQLTAPPASFSLFSSSLSALDSCLTPASLLEEDLPMFFTLPTSSSTPSSRLDEMEELCPSSSRTLLPLRPLDVAIKEEGRDSFLVDFTLDDAPFTDIDTSMYDLSSCSPPGACPSKTVPGVMDDLVRSGYGVAGAQNQPFKMNLAELDHTMEVLVGSCEE